MTKEEIKNHFGNIATYTFSGTMEELRILMEESGVGYNTLVANYGQIYFVCPAANCPSDEKITEIN